MCAFNRHLKPACRQESQWAGRVEAIDVEVQFMWSQLLMARDINCHWLQPVVGERLKNLNQAFSPDTTW
jgi:hypothetical protein